MSDLDTVAKLAQTYWTWLAGLGGGGLLIFVVRHFYKRLHPDQQACVEVIEQLELAADAVEAIAGQGAALEADRTRIRQANVHRRRAGTGIRDLLSDSKFDEVRKLLVVADRALGVLEDAINAAPAAGAANVREACNEVCAALYRVRSGFRRRVKSRPSVIIFGTRRFDLKDK